MKLTKLFVATAIAGVMFLGCSNNSTAGGGNGGSSETFPFRLTNGGKTVEINYTNETGKEQKFFVFAGENLGYNYRAAFNLYEQETNSPYEFGMIFDYKEDNFQSPCFDIFKLNVLNKNNEKRTEYEYLYGQCNGMYKEDFEALNFSILYDVNKTTKDQIFEEIDSRLVFIVKESNNNVTCSTQLGGKYEMLPKNSLSKIPGNKKFGYYLIIPDGSTCHLKLEISYLNE